MHPEEILESISGGFFALDRDYHFTYWNHAAQEGTGLKREEVLGKHVFEIFPNAEKSELGEAYHLAMTTKTIQMLVTTYRDKDFEVWYDVRIYPSDEGLSVFFQDITKQKLEEKQRDVFLEISHIINTSSRIDDLSSQISSVLGEWFGIPSTNILFYAFRKKQEQLVPMGMDVMDAERERRLTINITEQSAMAVVDAVITAQTVITTDVSRSSYGPLAPQLIGIATPGTVVAMPLSIEREIIGVMEILLMRDHGYANTQIPFLSIIVNELAIGISRRNLIEELRVKNVDLELQRAQTKEAHDTLKRFLAFFSHELRSPLNSIIGFSELISADPVKLPRERLKEYSDSIHSSGTHLLHLINDILDLSKLEADRVELNYGPITIRQFMDGLKYSLKPQLTAKAISLEIEVAEELDEMIADEIRLKQVLLNLLTNAIKFSYDEGKIILSVKRVDNNIEVSVQDFGIGMKPDDAEKIFQPFQQTGSADKKMEGTGLGLAITKKLVELHGGLICVVSEWQKGSTFIVRLPMRIGEFETTQKEPSLIPPLVQPNGPRRVLIVEDKSHAREILKTYLLDAGYEIETASNGVEAVEKVKIWKPDVITLDVLLPVKDGWQVMRELKAHPFCKDIPVIIVSMIDERKVGFGLGAIDYFVKPVQKEELLESVKRATLHRPPRSQSAKILAIDDDPSVTELIQVILEAEGCTVLKAQNGTEGIRLAETEHPDLIILDLMMPEISGFSVAYQLKQNIHTRTIPVMIMTSMDIDDETREQLQGFVIGLMKKSGFTKKDLLQEISSIEGKR